MEQQTFCKLKSFSQILVNQEEATIIVPAKSDATGFWFGSGNVVVVEDQTNLNGYQLFLCGRYRNFGDSRQGLKAGERGISLAIFSSTNKGKEWKLEFEWTKYQLSEHLKQEIVSIEGSCLYFNRQKNKWELYVSTEKKRNYPAGFEDYQKPGTGIWSIDVIESTDSSILTLAPETIKPVLISHDPETLHVKDPYVYEDHFGNTDLIFCIHPFNWSSANSGMAKRNKNENEFSKINWQFVNRGKCWDVAACRITSSFQIPENIKNLFSQSGDRLTLFYYDGAECVRQLEENEAAVKRPRGYSCEELGGLFIQINDGELVNQCNYFPLFLSPHGTACSRYIHSVATPDGIFTTWQQSQATRSQPLVSTFVTYERIREYFGVNYK